MQKIRIGTRGSQLALYQAELVKAKIENSLPSLAVEIVKIKTSGDMVRRSGSSPDAAKRLFTREIEDALLNNEVELAVHSAKDMAAELPPGLKIGAVLEREDARDCLVSKDGRKFAQLGLGARIGTSSVRRRSLVLRKNPDLIVEEIHGNVDTRMKKLEDGNLDALILAHAGLKRLGLAGNVTEVFGDEDFYPAPGQGAIAVQCRVEGIPEEVLKVLNHAPSAKVLECERGFLKRLEGGCQLPCGITTRLEKGKIIVKGILLDPDGKSVEAALEGSEAESAQSGERLAEAILASGGQAILDKIRHGQK